MQMRMRHPRLAAPAIRNKTAATATAPVDRATRSPAGARRSTVMAADANDTRDFAQRLSYSSWRRHHGFSDPFSSFLPHGARSRKR
jgi:hypothetical protein